ncbi:MAG: DEAD/DEAH box helicase [Elusimicrobiota bacterium]
MEKDPPVLGTNSGAAPYIYMEIVVESAGATAAAVRAAARGARGADAAAWARWTLTFEEAPEEGGFARALAWRLLNRGALVPFSPEFEAELRARFAARAASAAGAAHRLQCAAVLAEPSGLPARLDTDLARLGEFSTDEAGWLAERSRRDLDRLLRELALLYPEEAAPEGGAVFVSWTGEVKPGRRTAWALDGGQAAAEPFAFFASPPPFVRDDAALAALARRLFAVPTLRPGQADGLAALLSGEDLVLALPTGAGKSVVFQLGALLAPGTALVVAPLRALLRDQARRLAEAGVARVGLLVGDDAESTRRALAELGAGRLVLALAAPERLDSAAFRRALRGAAETSGVSFVAVDEAHCAARRGHDWRPAYRALGGRLRDWASTPGRVPALAALSGGCSPGALAEAEHALGLSTPVRVRAGAPRVNLSFRVWRSSARDHLPRLRELLTRRLPGGRFSPGIVFCPRVDGPLGAATVAEELIWSEGLDAAAFTGRPPRGTDAEAWAAAKGRAAADFLTGRRGLLCATRAFGLGVDRADVRFTAHLGLPASLEEYFQQAGRAGRDGAPAECWLILQVVSERRARRWAALPVEFLREEHAALGGAERDDVSRAYAFHLASFPGEAAERRDAELALWAAGDVGAPGDVLVELPGQDPEALTRALLRWEETGVLALEERRAGGWHVRRAGGWTPEAALAAADARISRDYSAIEPARRASLAELVEMLLSPDPSSALKERLLSASSPSSAISGKSGRSLSGSSGTA